MEWRGKVEPTYSSERLITAAQSQLEITGTWKVRSSHWENQVHHIECEQVPDETSYPPLPEESEVWSNFEAFTRKTTLPQGADQTAQAIKAQELFQETLLCAPTQHCGDHWEIALTRPKLFPITILYKGEPTKIWCDSTAHKSIVAEANRIFGRKFNLERKIDQPGLVFEANVQKSQKRPAPNDSTKTRSSRPATVRPSRLNQPTNPRKRWNRTRLHFPRIEFHDLQCPAGRISHTRRDDGFPLLKDEASASP
jgi:hypothetical protein